MAGRKLYPDDTDDSGPVLLSEAEGVIEEIQFAVSYAALSQKLPCIEDLVYFNLTTLENCSYCVELTVNGFRVSNATSFLQVKDTSGSHIAVI
jgi:Protein of unknown function (DUF727)